MKNRVNRPNRQVNVVRVGVGGCILDAPLYSTAQKAHEQHLDGPYRKGVGQPIIRHHDFVTAQQQMLTSRRSRNSRDSVALGIMP